ncbi:UNVERIFIED_ORG: hypothetical protein B2H98_08105 [Clostridium botulinum]
MPKIIKKLLLIFVLISMVFVNNTTIGFCNDRYNICDLNELEDVIYNGLIERENVIKFNYKGDKKEFVSNITETIKKAYKRDTYTERAWLNIEPYADVKKNGIEVNIVVKYLTTKEQEELINNEINKIIGEIINDKMTDIQKIEAVNNYLVDKFDYDYTYVSNNPYTAFKTGKTVCQGYSMTVYKILNKLNIPCEIVVGTSGNTSHSWNKVKINGTWRYLDVTNNDTNRSNKYFLVTKDILLNNDYVWTEDFKTEENNNGTRIN